MPAPIPAQTPKAATPRVNVFRHRDYALFWTARLLSAIAVMAEAVTIGWQVYAVARLHNGVEQSAFLVGMVGLVQFAPLLALTPIGGEAADRYDRKTIMLICLVVLIACDVILAWLAFTHHGQLWPIFAIAAVFGAVRAFPTHTALGPMLVPREELPTAIAWNSLAWQGGAMGGPMIAGFFIALSPGAAYVMAAALYVIAAVACAMIRGNTKPVAVDAPRWNQIKEGFAYVWRTKIVLGAISLDLFAVLLGGATALLPVFARDVLHVGSTGFGYLRAGPAVGAAIVAAVLGRWPLTKRAGLWMFGAVAVFGVATIVFALSKLLIVSVVAMAVLGAGDMVSVYVRQTLVQVTTPDAMRGRVAAISSVFIGASNEFGEFETGVVARLLGPIGAAVFGGVGSLLVTGVWAGLFPALRKADRLVVPETSVPISLSSPPLSSRPQGEARSAGTQDA